MMPPDSLLVFTGREENKLPLLSGVISSLITSETVPKIRHNLSVLTCHGGLSCALDIMEYIFHMVLLQKKL